MKASVLYAMRTIAFGYIWVQSVTMFVVSIIAFFCFNASCGYSYLLGGMASVLPNLYFAFILFKRTGAQSARYIVKSFYQGEFVKLLLTALLFALVFKFIQVQVVSFFAGYLMTQLAFWVAPLIIKTRLTEKYHEC